ncbi:MAG: HtrA2 peptidase [bacterium]|nr:MAG: HtrA2 peptidase [bacterium]
MESPLRRRAGSWLRGLLLALVGVAATLLVVDRLGAPPAPGSGSSRLAGAADPIGEGRRNAIVNAAELAGKGVVSITAVESRTYSVSPIPRGFEDVYSQFFGAVPGHTYREDVPKFGSGFILDRAGHVMTNAHVVAGAEEIQVTLADGRQLTGKVLGSDPAHDLAVIKVDGKELPAVSIGNSDDLLVGEWAIAIGNPFGHLLGDSHPTVTVGVISATNRDINVNLADGGIYKNMIQTDAAINRGNSGGALVNARGEVIGVNTFIFTEGGGSLGIGFAIPINTAAQVAREIIETGHVREVWIGISVVSLSPYLAARLGTQDTRGCVLSQLERGSPADRAGLEVGDIVRAIDGTAVVDAPSARRQIFGAKAGDTLVLRVERSGRTRDFGIRLENMPDRPGQQ